MINRFNLEEPLDSEQTGLSKQIIPVTVVDDLLRLTKVINTTVSMTGTGDFLFATVPNGKRWLIRAVTRVVSSGSYTSRIKLIIGSTGIHLTDGTTGSAYESALNYVMDEADTVVVNVTAYTSTGNTRVEILYEEEDAF